MARLKFRVSARVRTGPVADTTYVAYTDAAGTVLADISATEGGSALAGSSFTLDEFGKATIWGPTDGTSNLYLRTPDDASLGVQEITADADARLDTIEAASGIPASTVDAKGDLIAGTANNVVSRLAAGANGTVLTAASGQSTGLEWAAPAAGVTDHGALTGLADDDHPQYETSAEAAAKVTAHEASTSVHPSNASLAEQLGLLGISFDSGLPDSQTQLTAGNIYLTRIWVPKAGTAAKVRVAVAGAGASLANTFAGLYDAAGTRLAVTADESTALQGTGTKDLAFTAGVAVTAATHYWAALLAGSGTMPTLAAGLNNGNINNFDKLAAPWRFGFTGSSQTALPASITMASMSATGRAFLVGLVA